MDEQQIELEERKIWQEYLATASSSDLFNSVVTVNYDSVNSDAPLTKAILENPKVDKAVVLAFYWRLGPRFKKQHQTREDVPEHLLEEFDLIAELEAKFLSGFYSISEIYYDPKSDLGENWTTDYLEHDPNKTLPSQMEEALQGTIWLDEPYDLFDEGLPMDLAEKVFALYD